jgi:hypothetical protein
MIPSPGSRLDQHETAAPFGRRASSGRIARVRCQAAAVVCLLLFAASLSAQDLDPRAYAHVPIDGTFLVWGFAVSHGAVVTDPTIPVTDINATVETPSVGIARSFNLFGKTAQAFGAVPYSWAQVSGKVFEDQRSITRAGLNDMRFRFSLLLHGAPAASVLQIAKAPRRTILGTSLMVVAPTGQFFPDRLINLGTNRWAVKPEFAVSQPIGQRWLIDTYAGLWLVTGNDSFYPGTAARTQAPMGAFQAHVSYSIQRQMWAAFDATYYVGGRSTVNGIEGNDRQSNTRVGATFAFPVGKRHSIKLAVSTGAIVRAGANFSTFAFGWQTAWVPMPKPAK